MLPQSGIPQNQHSAVINAVQPYQQVARMANIDAVRGLHISMHGDHPITFKSIIQ